MKRTCKQCGKEFELPESEVNFYKSKGLELPKRCKSCREKNKGYSNQTGQRQKSVKPSSSTGGASWNGNNDYNNQNRNDKSYVVVAAVAVLFILLVVFIKNKLTLPSENTWVSEQTALSNTQSVPEPIKETSVAAAQGDASGETQQTKSADDKEPIKEQSTKEPEKKADELPKEQPKEQAQPDTDTQNETVPATVIETQSDAAPETQTVTFRFRKPQYLTEHFQKHGAEFPYATEEEYLLGANNVIQNPNALHKLEAEDGDDVYYVENTGEFVVVSTDGYIRTYFIASIDYYNRQ